MPLPLGSYGKYDMIFYHNPDIYIIYVPRDNNNNNYPHWKIKSIRLNNASMKIRGWRLPFPLLQGRVICIKE